MAHGDYDCCAICDCKQNYSEAIATTKETICLYCQKTLRTKGIEALDAQEFLLWAKAQPTEVLKTILIDIGYSICFYENSFDEEIFKLIQKPTPAE